MEFRFTYNTQFIKCPSVEKGQILLLSFCLSLSLILFPADLLLSLSCRSLSTDLAVLRIRDILVRIRIRGSVPLKSDQVIRLLILLFSSVTFQTATRNIFLQNIFAHYFLEVHLHHFSEINVIKKSQNRRNQGFSFYFCLMIEGSGVGSVPLTNGSGSGRPNNIRIRIRNTEI